MSGRKTTIKDSLASALLKGLEALGDPRVVVGVILAISFTITLLARLAPLHWGVYLNEFDPFYEYYLSVKTLENGNGSLLGGITWWYHWWFENPKPLDTLFWAPHGRDLRGSSQPGAALFTVAAYELLRTLGVKTDLYFVHGISVPVGAALAVFTAYLLGKELKDERTGVLSAVLISLSWAYMYRTNYGAKHEGFAIPFMLLGFYLFLVAYRRKSLGLSILAGLSFGMVVLSWGAYLYPWNFIALLSLIWLLFHPTDKIMAKIYIASNVITTLFVATTPRFGPKTAFLSLVGFLPLATTLYAFFLLIGYSRLRAATPSKIKKIGIGITGVVVIFFIVAYVAGLTSLISGRILAVVLPTIREPGVTTVAEHAVPSWNQLFDDFQSSIIFGIFAVYLFARRLKTDLNAAFAALYFATSLYFSSSIVRLVLLLSPAISVVASMGLIELFDRIRMLSSPSISRKKEKSVSPALAVLAMIILLLLFSPSILGSRVPIYSHQPALILTSSIPMIDYNYQYMDWISALEWIKINVPKDATIATWWDYGYWISVNTERKTTCDNATIDTKQIQRIATAFMSDEDTALKIFRELNVTYVVVFEPLQSLQLSTGMSVYFSMIHPALGGDMAKSPQMLKWIGLDAGKYIYGFNNGSYAYLDLGNNQRLYLLVPAPTPQGLNATLYRMIFTRNYKQQLFIFDSFLGQLQGYNGPHYLLSPLKHFELVYVSEPNGWVKVFKVKG
ncbi:STT3 domain-containing protein [Infirmifilum sp.]|uniref:STT3 domain-containing protein n=1 Tax=Infirmifilum sp. TaxID=2856575 RepID=UPI003D10F527